MGIGPYSISKETIEKIQAQRKKNRDEGIDFRLPKHVFTEERFIPECLVPDFYKLPHPRPPHIPDLTIERIHTAGINELSTAIWSHSISFMVRELHLLRKSYWEKEPFKIFGPVVRHFPFDYTFNITGHQGVAFRWRNYICDKQTIRAKYSFLLPRKPYGSLSSACSSELFPSTYYLWYINQFNPSFFSNRSPIRPLNIPFNDFTYANRLHYRLLYMHKRKLLLLRWYAVERWVRSQNNSDLKKDNLIIGKLNMINLLQKKWINILLCMYFLHDYDLKQSVKFLTKKLVYWFLDLFLKIFIYIIKHIINIGLHFTLVIEKLFFYSSFIYNKLLYFFFNYILPSSYFISMLTMLSNTTFITLIISIFLSVFIQPLINFKYVILIINLLICFTQLSSTIYEAWMFLNSIMHIVVFDWLTLYLQVWNHINALFHIKFIAQQILPYKVKVLLIDLKNFYNKHDPAIIDIMFPVSDAHRLAALKYFGYQVYKLIYFLSERLTPYKMERLPKIRSKEMETFRSVNLENLEFLLSLLYIQLDNYYEYQRKKEFQLSVEIEETNKWQQDIQLDKIKELIKDTLRDIERVKVVHAEKIEELQQLGTVIYGESRDLDLDYGVTFIDDERFLDLDDSLIENSSDSLSSIIPDGTILSNVLSTPIPYEAVLPNVLSTPIPYEAVLPNVLSTPIPYDAILSNVFLNINRMGEHFHYLFSCVCGT